jgi:transcriptional regulator with XRE-family HTH domain
VAPQTVGDHIRKKRLGLKLHQKDVAEQLGVDQTSVFNWEGNRSSPDFLGYNPLPAANTLAEQLVRQRTTLGLSQKESAGRIGVDQGTLARWERGEREPAGAFLVWVKRFLQDGEASGARRAG